MSFISISIDICGSTSVKAMLRGHSALIGTKASELYDSFQRQVLWVEDTFWTMLRSSKLDTIWLTGVLILLTCFSTPVAYGQEGLRIDGVLNPGAVSCESEKALINYKKGDERREVSPANQCYKNNTPLHLPITIRKRSENERVYVAVYFIQRAYDRGDGKKVWNYKVSYVWTYLKYLKLK